MSSIPKDALPNFQQSNRPMLNLTLDTKDQIKQDSDDLNKAITAMEAQREEQQMAAAQDAAKQRIAQDVTRQRVVQSNTASRAATERVNAARQAKEKAAHSHDTLQYALLARKLTERSS